MTLAAYNARRKALARLERIGWLNHRLNMLMNIATLVAKEPMTLWLPQNVEYIDGMASSIRAYRAKHKFWECQ